MTVEEIFSKLATHMIEGIMTHDKMSQLYDFLGLEGFALCHNYHHIEESNNYICLCHYYSCHYHKLIKIENISESDIIPDVWYKYTTMAVDTGTKRNSIKELMNKWIEWEQATKKLYQEMHKALLEIGEVAAALQITFFISDVEKELSHAEKKLIKLETANYDPVMITDWQKSMKKKYKKKLGW